MAEITGYSSAARASVSGCDEHQPRRLTRPSGARSADAMLMACSEATRWRLIGWGCASAVSGNASRTASPTSPSQWRSNIEKLLIRFTRTPGPRTYLTEEQPLINVPGCRWGDVAAGLVVAVR